MFSIILKKLDTPFVDVPLTQDEIQIGVIIQMDVKRVRIKHVILEMCNITSVCVATVKSITIVQ